MTTYEITTQVDGQRTGRRYTNVETVQAESPEEARAEYSLRASALGWTIVAVNVEAN